MENSLKDKIICNICSEPAVNLCFKCAMYLCDSCHKFIHNKNNNKNHKRGKIDYFVPFPLKCSEHPKDRINLFCLNENSKFIFLYINNFNIIELCCSICNLRNIHNGHKLINIEDEERLNKENITIDSAYDKYNEMIQKLEKLKNKIENENKSIDILYEKINNEITEVYKQKCEKLISEENNLKENLRNEVTKTKEKLENDLSKCNDLLRIKVE